VAVRILRSRALLGCVGLALVFGTAAGAGVSKAPSFAAAKSFDTDNGPNTLAMGDVDGDGRLDLVTSNENVAPGTLSVLLGDGKGGFGPRSDYEVGSTPYGVEIHDLNGDGKPDLIAANFTENGSVSVLLNQGGGSFGAPTAFSVGRSPVSLAIADLDANGAPDVVAANTDGDNVSVLLNRGDGSFAPSVDYVAGRRPGSVAAADLDGDGDQDLVTAGTLGTTVLVHSNRGDGTFAPPSAHRVAEEPGSVTVADLNGDHRPDLVAQCPGGIVSVLLGKGGGRFGVHHDFRSGTMYGRSLGVADVNGDHKLDLAAIASSNAVSVLLNRGDGSFLPRLSYPVGPTQPYPASIAVGDLTGDGRPDLATANYWTNTVSVLLSRPGLCNVQDVRRLALAAARSQLVRAHCVVGRVTYAYAKKVKRGSVISQSPRFGLVGPRGGKVRLVVSRGAG